MKAVALTEEKSEKTLKNGEGLKLQVFFTLCCFDASFGMDRMIH